MATKVTKPNGMIFHEIKLNLNNINSQKASFQERFYQPQNYFIEKDENTAEYYLRNTTPCATPSPLENTAEYIVHSFVITEEANYLKLEIGDANHHIIAKNAPFVAAAGDIYELRSNRKIFKITDQSKYHAQNTDPLIHEKKESAKRAMRLVGLPMHLFVPFKPEPLMFSDKLRHSLTIKGKDEIAKYNPTKLKIKNPL